MKDFVGQYSDYLQNVKQTSENTRLSYMRDLKKFSAYLNEMGIVRFEDVNNTNVMGFVFALEKENKTPATISRCLATLHSFFRFLFNKGIIDLDPTEGVKAPKVVRKAPSFMSLSSVERLLNQPMGNSNKAIRDRAMLEVLYATGIRVSELVNLSLIHI